MPCVHQLDRRCAIEIKKLEYLFSLSLNMYGLGGGEVNIKI